MVCNNGNNPESVTFFKHRYCIADRIGKLFHRGSNIEQKPGCFLFIYYFFVNSLSTSSESFLRLAEFFSVSEMALIFLNSRADGIGTIPFGFFFVTE